MDSSLDHNLNLTLQLDKIKMNEEQDCIDEIEKSSVYKDFEMIGSGGYGDVYKCRNTLNDQIVAIKIIPICSEDAGVPSAIIREVSVLMEIEHENVVRLLEVLSPGQQYVYLVFEYLDVDLKSFIKSPKINDSNLVKNFLQQILRGVAYCHAQKVLHRDLKPANLLIDLNSNTVKVADFGLARDFEVPRPEYTVQVGTSFYKAPEVLFGSSQYSTAIDMWAVGCIFGEMAMAMEQPLFSTHEMYILDSISSLLGTPTEENWPGVTSLCDRIANLRKHDPKDLRKEFSRLDTAGVDLLSRMLCLDPNKRISANDALEHEYFKDVQNVS